MFSYRNAKEIDFTVISAFPQNAAEQYYMFPKGSYPLKPDQLAEAARSRVLPTVIERGGEVAGYGNFYDVKERDHAWLGNIIVNPKCRGNGAGAYLLNVMKERAREELHLRQLRLICHNTNTAALALYHKLGFQPFEIRISEGKRDIVGIAMRTDLP
ncbi:MULTISPECIES: N-acetyltransferase [unclassified Paenibacillus]|uniref:GNAT family N-acetyltransferase n=1 Tax=unclassified Paenibacillus TaxID=185978 RepID=UPI001C0F71CA|nr:MULTISPECIES: GNAT family N-acetyltransferase [unclassified Paenibacillus]MBU5444886.1 GNAT family N-acetyltransferase [Paenibacillus sp. MSJ-34]CAH0121760.1 Mycothiol acetyltransferase [Paenibacillus sp. CECT 9249]